MWFGVLGFWAGLAGFWRLLCGWFYDGCLLILCIGGLVGQCA